MTSSIAAEEIYDALVDDECFAQLPSRMNQAYGARSCTLHWWHGDNATAIVGHSGYFSDEQMLNYATNFTHTDLWSLEGVKPSRSNQVLNCDDIVSARDYERSAFYNDWLRAMGDDTFHCIGIAMRTRWGFGMIGLHRGRSQGPFSAENVRALSDDVPALRRMLTMRGRLSQAQLKTSHSEAVLDGIGQALFLLTATGRLLHANAAGDELLDRFGGLTVRQDVLSAASPRDDRALKAAIARAAAPSQPAAGAVAIACPAGRRLDLSLVGVPSASGPRNVLVTTTGSDTLDDTVEQRLRALYALSPGETCLAVMLARGACPAEIAEQRNVTLGTVRVQIKSIAVKLGCHRQTDIVRIVKSLPALRSGTAWR